MAGLSTRLLVDLRCLWLRWLVALRLGVPAWPAPAGHLPLCLRRLGCAPFPVPAVGKVVGGVGGRGGGLDAPVDADDALGGGCKLDVAANHERHLPIAEGVLVDTARGGFGRQVTGPDDGDPHSAGLAQPLVLQAQPSGRVLQRRQRLVELLERRPTATLHLERPVVRGHVGCLLYTSPSPRDGLL